MSTEFTRDQQLLIKCAQVSSLWGWMSFWINAKALVWSDWMISKLPARRKS